MQSFDVISHFMGRLFPSPATASNQNIPPLLSELWQRIMCYLPIPEHVRFWKGINRTISSLLPYQPYWEVALNERFPCSAFTAPTPFEKYKYCHITHNNLIQRKWNIQKFHPYSDKEFSCYQFEVQDPEVPHTLNLGPQYIALLTNGGLLSWFDTGTHEKKGELQFSKDTFSNHAQTPIKECQGRFYLTLTAQGSQNKILTVVCPESNTLLFSSTPFPGPKNNLDGENFKILNGFLYLLASDKTIEIYDTKNYSRQILTNLVSEEEEIITFDVNASKKLLHVIMLSKEEKRPEKIVTFDLNSFCDGKLEKIGELAFYPDCRLTAASTQGTGAEREPLNICRMNDNYIRSQRDLKDRSDIINKTFSYEEFCVDFENGQINKVFSGAGPYCNETGRSFQTSGDYLFYKTYIMFEQNVVSISNSHNGSGINTVCSNSYLTLPAYGILAFSATAERIALVHQTVQLPMHADFVVEVIHFNAPPKPELAHGVRDIVNKCSQVFQETTDNCQTQ